MNTPAVSSTLRTQAVALPSSAPGMLKADVAPQEGETRVGHLAASGFGIGGTIGAVIGAVAVGIASMTTEVVLPGSALYVAGPLSAMLLGAGAGAANGGLAGALIGWGIPVEVSQDTADRAGASRSLRQNLRAAVCPHAK